MDAVIGYTITGIVELSKLVVNSLSFLVAGSHGGDLRSIVLKVDGMDLHAKMTLLERLVKEYPSNHELVMNLDKTLRTLYANLDKIQTEINNHNLKWFRRYRKIDVSDLLLQLDRDNSIITERLRYLICISEAQRLIK
jgi:hypothetical protein